MSEKKTSIIIVGCGAGIIWESGSLSELAKSGLKYSTIHGSSSGAIAAACFHAGQTQELVDFVMKVKNKDVYKLAYPWWSLTQKACLYNNAPLRRTLAGILNFDALRKAAGKCIIHTTSVETWDDHLNDLSTFTDDQILDAIVASTSIPVMFPPLGGFIDGGVSNDVPINAALEPDTERVILISGSSPPSGVPKNINQMIGKFLGSTSFVQRELMVNTVKALSPKLEIIQVFPETSLGISVIGFDDLGNAERRTQLVNLGREAMKKALLTM